MKKLLVLEDCSTMEFSRHKLSIGTELPSRLQKHDEI